MTDHETFKRWGGTIMTIHASIEDAVLRRKIFRETVKVVNANPNIQRESAFWDWMGAAHVESMLMTIRRQVDQDRRSVSLHNLLTEIRDYPQALSRQNVLAMLPPEVHQFGNARFDLFVGEGCAHADTKVIADDLAALGRQTEVVRRYANKRVAHYDERGPTTIPTFEDLDDALDVILGLFRRYLAVLRCLDFAGDPEFTHDWKVIFRQPWIP